MNNKLKGKVAIVTGGAVRIGRALSLSLAKAGCKVMIHYGQSEQSAKETQKEIQSAGAQSVVFSEDLSNSQESGKIFDVAIEAFGSVDILINCAAIFPEEDRFSDVNTELWEKIININLRAPFFLCREFAKRLPSGNQGKIININDARIANPGTDHIIYRLAKRGLWDLTEILALELAPSIQVNGIALGAILPPPGKDKEFLEEKRRKRIPLKRLGNPQIASDTVLYLIRNDFITGETIRVDGGEFIGRLKN